MANESDNTFERVKLIALWAFVGIPLLWGVSQTFMKALALF